jgi:DNA invertase Pin-like site-specific DNA recombinase
VERARQHGLYSIAHLLRLDRWGRSVTDLLATLQEQEHLRAGFESRTEAFYLTTPESRGMAALLAVVAGFEREILRERVRADHYHLQSFFKCNRISWRTIYIQTGQIP